MQQNGIEVTQSEQKLIINNVAYGQINLLDFIQITSNTSLQQLPTVFNFEGSFDDFQKYIISTLNLQGDNDLVFVFKYLVAIIFWYQANIKTFTRIRRTVFFRYHI